MTPVDLVQTIVLVLLVGAVLFQQRRIRRLENLKVLKDFLKSEKLKRAK